MTYPPHHRCPWFWSGLLLGLISGAALIHHGTTHAPNYNHSLTH
jgi:hypothetical protein